VIVPRRRRRRIDAAVAAVIVIGLAVAALVIWHGSDLRATTLNTAPPGAAPATPTPMTAVPETLTRRWTLATDPEYGSVASPYGTVITADTHSVIAHDAVTGDEVWRYTRAGRRLCAIGSGDTTTDRLDTWSGVHGIMTLYAKNGYCSQVTDFDPSTGTRLYQRTSPNQEPGQLFFGKPYVGWTGSDYLELWRHDLVATIRYGNQPNPVDANGPHLGCTFSDVAVTTDQLATIEHCGDTTHLVLNWPTPSDAPDKGDKGWDANHSTPKATITLPGKNAVIVGVTADRVAVLVAAPSPTLAVYDSRGTQTASKPVDVAADEIEATAKAGLTPAVRYDGRRYTLVGHHLLAVSPQTVTVEVPVTSTATTASTPVPTGGTGGTGGTGATGAGGAPASSVGRTSTTTRSTRKDEQNPRLDWTADDALGLPAQVDAEVLVPTPGGLEAHNAVSGKVTRTIPVDRGGYTGRVDATTVGNIIVEARGKKVVGLAP
jgi:hypothetical protein